MSSQNLDTHESDECGHPKVNLEKRGQETVGVHDIRPLRLIVHSWADLLDSITLVPQNIVL
jgi:hypothetical protein